MREGDLQRLFLIAAAERIPNLRLFRRNVGSVQMEDGRRFRSGIPGMADLYGYWQDSARRARPIEIEIKGLKGRLSKEQEAWRDWCLAHAVPWVLLQPMKDETPEQTVIAWCIQVRSVMDKWSLVPRELERKET